MRVRLVRKLADVVDGVDLSHVQVGDVVELSEHDAQLLIAEAWAVPARVSPPRKVGSRSERRRFSRPPPRDLAAERLRVARSQQQLRRLREQLERTRTSEQERRRAEDRIREELHDARARTIKPEAATPKKR